METSVLAQDVHSPISYAETCISKIKYLMIENKLQVNDDNMECHLICPNKCTQNVNRTFLSYGHNVILFTTTAKKNLGFHLRDDMRIDVPVQDIYRKAYIDIQCISSTGLLLSIDATKTHAFVLPKLDYCNYLLYGSQMYMLERQQKVQKICSKANFSMLQTKSHFTPSYISAQAAH